jgi:hypothetical protein
LGKGIVREDQDLRSVSIGGRSPPMAEHPLPVIPDRSGGSTSQKRSIKGLDCQSVNSIVKKIPTEPVKQPPWKAISILDSFKLIPTIIVFTLGYEKESP